MYSSTGPLDRDYDDVRRFYDAAERGMKRALDCGASKPLLVCPGDPAFPRSVTVAMLGALQALYVVSRIF